MVASDNVHGAQGQLVQIDRRERLPLAVATGQFHEIADEPRQLADLCDGVADQHVPLGGLELIGACEDFDVGPHRGQRRAQLVRGVSDEPPLLRERLGQGVEHGVEAPGQTAEVITARDFEMMRELPRASHRLGGAGDAVYRGGCGRGDKTADQRCQSDGGDRDGDERDQQLPEGLVDLLE